MEKKELLEVERKNLFEKAPDFRTQETMTFELDFIKYWDTDSIKSEKSTKVIIKTSPYSEKLAKAIKGYDDFILLQDHHYGYTESALGWIKYAEDNIADLIGMLKFYESDTFFINGKEVWMQDFIMALKFDAQAPVSYCDF